MSKAKQGLILRGLTIIIWVVAFYLLISSNWWYLLGMIVVLHVIELPLKGYQAGVKAGYSGLYSSVMTLVFGFTWWLYLSE